MATIQIYLTDSTRTGLAVEVVARWCDRGATPIELLRSELGTHTGSVASSIAEDVRDRLRAEHPGDVVECFSRKAEADRSWSLRHLGHRDGSPPRR